MTSAPDGAPPLALVTGGTHRLGAAIAARLAAAGYALALHYHRSAGPDTALAAALAAHGTAWHGFPANLGDGDAVAGLIPSVAAHFGRPPALLVNNAARFAESDWTTLTLAELEAMAAVNHHAPVLLATALAKATASGGQTAAVVNIIDQRVANPVPDQLAYGLSKGALAASTRALAVALAPLVRVNGVAPGLTIDTPDYQAGQAARLAARMALRRLPSPDDIADAVLYLAGARATTGQIIFVDGGASLSPMARDFLYLDRAGDVGDSFSDS